MIVSPHVLAAIRQPAVVYRPEGIVEAANDLAEALAGAPLEGMTPADVLACVSIRHRDGTPLLPNELPAARALRGEEVVDLPLDITTADGRTVRVLATASPVRNSDAIAGVLSVWQDVTALVAGQALGARSEAGARQNEELAAADAVAVERQRLFTVLEALPVAICLLTPDYGIAFANRTFRETIGASEGRPCYEACFGLPAPCPFCESFRVLETGEPHRWEVALPNGRILEANDLPFIDADGTPMVLEMDRDITDQRRVEAALREANLALDERVRRRTAELEVANVHLRTEIGERERAERELQRYVGRLARSNEELQRFAYVASHDLQEPLRSIVSFSQLLERRCRGKLDADADEYIDFIVEGGNRMQRLIRDLLRVSRVETQAKEPVPTDAARAAREALAVFNGQLGEIGGSVTIEPLPTVMADAAQLEQVFANLVGNAIKYRKPDVPLEVTVSAERTNGMVAFAVSDNGIGIEAEYFDRIFEMFRRLHTHDQYEGTGIGLAVVKRIVERHGGTVRVESTPGQGSTFSFTLPAA